jgi:pimeloyl-ACP methyl ester carboxylesterase
MGEPEVASAARREPASRDIRKQLLAGAPVVERHHELAGIPTAVLEGGDGPPVVLLHSSGEFAALWRRVLPELVTTYRLVAPDLPGHGASGVPEGPLDVDRTLAWLAALIERTCSSQPIVVARGLGGAIAARFAVDHSEQLARLVLVGPLGLAPFAPTPGYGAALQQFVTEPTADTRDALFGHCFVGLDVLRRDLGVQWNAIAMYALDRARTPAGQSSAAALMQQFGLPAIPQADLERITVETSLIWGTEDPAVLLAVGEAAHGQLGWPLRTIEHAGDDPPLERPAAFVAALRAELRSRTVEAG